MGRSHENRGFRCVLCERDVQPLTNGSYRNHCPYCLASRHLDDAPGDRAARCGGVMDACGLRASKKGLQLAHRCRACGVVRYNRVAEETTQPDDVGQILRLMLHSAESQRGGAWRKTKHH